MPWREFSGTDRFEVLSRLGSGGMGVVYEVLDRERNARVALKKLRTPSPEALLRFKKEFRALERVQHPNLVMLGELFEERGDWFFTMELVEGVDFLEHVRPDGVLDVARLRAALSQLAAAVAALHAAGKIHRDIKPANVIVERSGRLALIDLGLVLNLDDRSIPDRDSVAGTANFMAPEQAVASNSVGPEADWYSVGAVLFNALTGQVPFEGTPLQVMLAKQQHAAPPADSVASALPGDLVVLAAQLLATNPDERPSDAELVRRLGVDTGSQASASSTAMPFVGRSRELTSLVSHFQRAEEAPVSVLVRGNSGVGKTSLVQHFVSRLDALAEPNHRVLVLAGRCHERESVPFKAFDDVIDALARFLVGQTTEAVQLMLPPGARSLARVFPALRRVEAIAVAPPDDAEPADDRERRARVFGALRELFTRLAAYRRLVITLDDLQWADADSAVLLRELLRPPDAPRLLLVATVRTGGDAPPALDLPGDVATLELSGLPEADALELARLHAAQPALISELAAAVAREADGHPLFIAELVRYALENPGRSLTDLRLDEAVWSRIQTLPAPVRRLLSLVAMSGAPLEQGVAARAAEAADYNEYARWVATLRGAFLVRTTGVRANDRVEPYHDRVRDAVLGQLAPEVRSVCHRRLAVALEGTPEADPESLTYHWHGAGDLAAAATHALEAARRADQAYAFDHAARLYELAIGLEQPSGERLAELLGRRADALANAGRGAHAGHVYLEAATTAHQEVALELKRRAAEQLLRAGHIAKGMNVLDQVLDPIGMHLAKTPTRALVSLGMTRARVRMRGLGFRSREERDIPREQLIRIDTCWAVSVGLALVDPIRASDFQARQLLLALRMGEPFRVCRGLIAEAGYRSIVGGPGRVRVRKMLDRCLALANEIQSHRAIALHRMIAGISTYLVGEWKASIEHSLDAERRIQQQVGMSWELFNARYYLVLARYWTGDLRGFSQQIPQMLADADEHGDLLAGTTLRNGLIAIDPLLRDDPDRARADSIDVVSRLTDQFNFQHYWQMIALMNAGIYASEVDQTFAALDQGWERSRKAMVLRIQYIRVEAYWTRARAHLAAAEQCTGAERQRHLAVVKDAARRLSRERMPWIEPKAALLRAALADFGGAPERALEQLQAAAAGFEAADMHAFAVAARRVHGALLGGEDGTRAVREADAWMSSQGVAAPARLAAMWIPGFSRRG